MGIVLKNNAKSVLSAGISSTDTTIPILDVSSFPTLGVGEYFYCTIENTSGAYEIVKVTQVNTSSFVAVRAQESTLAIPFSIGARTELRVTVQALEDHFEATAGAVVDATIAARIGVSIQAYDADLTTWAGLTPSANAQSLVTAANYAAMRTLLSLVPGTDVQAYDADLTSWAAITRASGFDTFVATPSSANLRSLLTDETGTGAAVFAASPTLTGTLTAAAANFSSYVGVFNSSPSSIGMLAVGTAGQIYQPDSAIIVARSIDDTTTAQHCFTDTTVINRSTTAATAYNSFVSNITVGGSQSYDHFSGFETYRIIGTAGTVTNLFAFHDVTVVSAGTVTNRYAFYPFDVTGAGTLQNNYGLYVPALTKGSVSNYAIYVESTPSAFGGAVHPTSDDAAALGTATKSWADLFLASGGVINFNNGDVTVTHSANTLAFAGASSGYTFDDATTVSKNQNAATILKASNTTNGATATATLRLTSDGGSFDINMLSAANGLSSWVTVGAPSVLSINPTGSLLLASNGNVGITVASTGVATATTPTAGTNNTQIATTAFVVSGFQPLDADLTSWAAITRASGFDTFVATPSSANLRSLLTDETGTGAAVFADTPTLVTPNIGAATGTSVVLSSSATATAFIPSSSTVPTNGLYLPAANTLGFAINSAGEVQLTSTALSPVTSDGNALGTTTLMWADLFLASGGVINFNNGDVTLTHSSALLTSNSSISISKNQAAITSATLSNTQADTSASVYNYLITSAGTGYLALLSAEAVFASWMVLQAPSVLSIASTGVMFLTATGADVNIARASGATLGVSSSSVTVDKDFFVKGKAIWRTVASSAVAIARNSVNGAGDATDTAQVTVSIPAGDMGPNGRVRVTFFGSQTNSANVKTWRVWFNGIGGTAYYSTAATSQACIQTQIIIRNRNSASSQVGYTSATPASFGQTTGAKTTSAVNTANAVDIVISNLWAGATASETMTLEDYHIEVCYGA